MYENDESTVNAVAEVPVVEEQVADLGGEDTTVGTADNVVETEQQETTEPARQTRKENAEFAQQRRTRESELARELAETRRTNDLLKQGLSAYFGGETEEDMALSALAYANHMSKEEYEAQYRQQLAAEQQRQAVTSELEFYRSERMKVAMAEDLKAIQAIDPLVKSLEDLGEDYAKMISAGIPATTAYYAVRETMPKRTVPSMGAINNTNGDNENDFFTDEQLDLLTDKQLDNPKTLAKAIRSLTKKK